MFWYQILKATTWHRIFGDEPKRWPLVNLHFVPVCHLTGFPESLHQCEAFSATENDDLQSSYYTFLFAAALAGLGNTGRNVIAMPYIDESVRKEDSPLYIGTKY